MELQDVEYIYKGAIKDLKDNIKKVDAMNKEIVSLDKKIILNRADAIRAEEKSQMSGISDAEKDNYLKEMEEKNKLATELLVLVGTRREDLKKLKTEVENLQKKIDGIIAEVSQNPEVAQLIKENVEAKRQQKAKTKDMKKKAEDREKKDKEKKELETRKSKLDKIMEIVNKNPKAKKALIDIIKLRKRKKDLEEELKTCKDDSRKVKIYEELDDMRQKELPKVKDKYLEHFGKENIGISEDIDAIINNGLTLDKKGNIDLKSTLQNYSKNLVKGINDITKEITVLDKEIAPYKDLLGVQSQPQGQQQGDDASEVGENEGQEQGDESSDSGRDEEEKPSLWQRVKNWFKMTPEERKANREERKARKEQRLLNSVDEEQQEPKDEQPVEISKERREMLNKYKVVQQIEKDAWDKMITDAQQTVQPKNNEMEK